MTISPSIIADKFTINLQDCQFVNWMFVRLPGYIQIKQSVFGNIAHYRSTTFCNKLSFI